MTAEDGSETTPVKVANKPCACARTEVAIDNATSWAVINRNKTNRRDLDIETPFYHHAEAMYLIVLNHLNA